MKKIIAQQKEDIKTRLLSGYSLTDDSIVERETETSLVLDHFESANITTDQGESIFDVHEYQVYNVKYDVYPVHADIENGVIKTIRIDNAKLAFKPGEAPQFTATVAAGYENLYELYCQDWSVGPWTPDALKVHASNNPEDYAFKTFEKGQKYSYSVFVRLTSDNTKEYKFAEDAKLILNGKEVTYSSKSVNRNYIDFYDVAEMSPTEEVVPDQGNTDQSKDNNAAGKTDAKTQKNDSSAKTGDEASPLLWAVILLLAAAGGATAVLYRRKAKN